MAKLRKKKAKSGVAKSSTASSGKTTGASTQQQALASNSVEDVLRAAQSAEAAVAAAGQGDTETDVEKLHPDERAVHLAVHGARGQNKA